MATVVTNALSAVPMAVALARRLPELRWRPLLAAFGVSAAAGLAAACASRGVHAAACSAAGAVLAHSRSGVAAWLADAVRLPA